MGNKRQREARKKFIAAGGVPATPTSNKRPREGDELQEVSKKKKKKTVQKEQGVKDRQGSPLNGIIKIVENGEDTATVSSKGKKWRQEKFGEGKGCHLCGGTDHVKRDCPTYDAKKVCLLCRQRGHSIKRCPQNMGGEDAVGVVEAPKGAGPACYNCGQTGHRLADCQKPLKDGGAAFAVCFVCNQKGHLSKACPSNTHGIYPKGGSCNICGEVTHLAKDCPQKAQKKTKLQIPGLGPASTAAAFGSKRVVFQSGDDLDDDFLNEGAEDIAEEAVAQSEEEDEGGEGGGVRQGSGATKKVVSEKRKKNKKFK